VAILLRCCCRGFVARNQISGEVPRAKNRRVGWVFAGAPVVILRGRSGIRSRSLSISSLDVLYLLTCSAAGHASRVHP